MTHFRQKHIAVLLLWILVLIPVSSMAMSTLMFYSVDSSQPPCHDQNMLSQSSSVSTAQTGSMKNSSFEHGSMPSECKDTCCDSASCSVNVSLLFDTPKIALPRDSSIQFSLPHRSNLTQSKNTLFRPPRA